MALVNSGFIRAKEFLRKLSTVWARNLKKRSPVLFEAEKCDSKYLKGHRIIRLPAWLIIFRAGPFYTSLVTYRFDCFKLQIVSVETEFQSS